MVGGGLSWLGSSLPWRQQHISRQGRRGGERSETEGERGRELETTRLCMERRGLTEVLARLLGRAQGPAVGKPLSWACGQQGTSSVTPLHTAHLEVSTGLFLFLHW